MMAMTFGPVPVLRALMADLPGARYAWIYGSWAARHDQQPGSVPGSIDALVVGSGDLEQVAPSAESAARLLAEAERHLRSAELVAAM